MDHCSSFNNCSVLMLLDLYNSPVCAYIYFNLPIWYKLNLVNFNYRTRIEGRNINEKVPSYNNCFYNVIIIFI